METVGPVAFIHLMRRRYDLVHALTPTAALAGRASGHRTVYSLLGVPTLEQYAGRAHQLRLLKAATRAAHVTTALSIGAAEAAEELTRRRCEILGAGVRLERFEPRLEPRTGPPTVLFSSNQSDPRKGLSYLLAAMAGLLDEHPSARLRLTGPGDWTQAVATLDESTRRRVLPAVENVGPEVDMAEEYRRAWVTTLPARFEAFGLVLIESLASGTPVVCSRDGGMTDIVDDPRVGRVAPFADVAALRGALSEALALAHRRETPLRCSEHARRWDWRTVVGPAYESLYRRVVKVPRDV
jgi:glycosyltransferase involved in cell wall biosynthesis